MLNKLVINITPTALELTTYDLQELEEQLNFKIEHEQAAAAAHIDNIFQAARENCDSLQRPSFITSVTT